MRLGGLIQSRRQDAGLTQADLAEAVGLAAPQTVSDIERGVREVKAWELARIARALRTPLDHLLELEERPSAQVMWRRGSTAAAKQTEERFLDRARRYALLEKWNDLPPAPRLPQRTLSLKESSYPDAARLARDIEKTLDLGSRPAASLAAVLQEGFRVKLFFEPLGDGESAASAKGDFGCAVLMNSSEAPWRRNFSLAHEVFHLVTWESTVDAWGSEDVEVEWLEHVEKLANAFAARLLLPADEIAVQYDDRFGEGEVEYLALIEMAREFEVSTEALVWRLRQLGKLTQEKAEEILADPEFRREDRRTMPDRWGAEPEGPLPRRYWRLAFNAYRRGQMTLARLADILEISVSEAGQLIMADDDAHEAAAPPA